MSTKDMDVQKKVETITERGRHPYFRFLKTTFDLETVDSRTDTPEAVNHHAKAPADRQLMGPPKSA